MPLVQSGLLKAYFKALNSANAITGGNTNLWNETSRKIAYLKRPYMFSLALISILGLPEIYHVAQLSKKKVAITDSHREEKTTMLTIGFLMAAAHTVSSLSVICFLRHGRDWESFLNALLGNEKKFWKQGMTSDEMRIANLTKHMINLLATAIQTLGLLIPGIAAVIPNWPLNVFSYLPGSCVIKCFENMIAAITNSQLVRTIVETTIIYLVNCVIWSIEVKRSVVAASEVVIGSICLTLSLLRLKRLMNCSNYGGRKDSTCRQGEILNNLYRQIQILSTLFNQIASQQLVAIFLGFGPAQVVCALELFRKKNVPDKHNGKVVQESLKTLMIFKIGLCWLVVIYSTIVINFLYGFCGNVHNASIKLLRQLSRQLTGKEPNVYLKRVRSYLPVKVRFGSTNFIDKLTPVVLQMFLVTRLIDLLLVK